MLTPPKKKKQPVINIDPRVFQRKNAINILGTNAINIPPLTVKKNRVNTAAILGAKAFLAKAFVFNRPQGIPKSDLKVPYTNSKEPADTLLYALNSDPSKKRFVPRFKIGVHRISGAQQFKIELTEATEGEGGFLKLSLETIAPDELKNKLNGASAMDHKAVFTLRFTVPGTGIDKRMPFDEQQETELGYDITLKIPTFSEFNQVFNAIADSNYACKLEIWRSVSVAAPKFTEPGKGGTGKLKPILSFQKKESSVVRGTKFNRIYLSIQNWNAFPNTLFKASPELPPCGLNKKASRTWVDIFDNKGKRLYGYCAFGSNTNLQKFSFAVRADRPIPSGCYVVLHDRKANKKFTSNTVNLKGRPSTKTAKAGEKLYKVVSRNFLQTEPFNFPESQHPYIFRNIGTRDTAARGFKTFSIKWEKDGAEHLYLQDEVNKKRFLYFPDGYTLARETGPFFTPKVRAAFSGDTQKELQVRVSYEADAFMDFDRWNDAYAKLPKLSATDGEITLSPLVLSGEQLKFKLSVPESSGFMPRPDSLLTLESINDTLPPISIESFQVLFQNLITHTGASNMLTGHVEIDLPGIPVPPIPVSIRLTLVDTKMLTVEYIENSNFKINIKNETAKTLSAQGVLVSVQDGENTFTGSKVGLELPLQLAPGASKTFTVIPKVLPEKPQEAIVGLTWEGMQQQEANGSLTATSESFSSTGQELVLGHSVQVTNPTESNVTIDGVKAFVQSNETDIPLLVKNLSLPITLASGASLSFDLVADQGMGKYDSDNIFFVWEGMDSQPDREKLIDTIIDTSVNATYETLIKVSLFTAPISPDSEIRLIEVEFKSSEDGPVSDASITFDSTIAPNSAGFVEKEITLQSPIKNYVLNETAGFWYRIVLIKKTDGGNDTKTVAGEWKSLDGADLKITTDKLPNEKTDEQ